MEFLIRIVDKGVQIDASKAGDVIAAMPDGWAWSQAELTNPEWRIVSVLGVLQSTVDALLSQTQVESAQKRRREYGVDFSQLPDPTLFQYTGLRPQEIISLTKQQVTKAAYKKP